MKKIILPFIVLLSVSASCVKEEISIYDELNEDERNAVNLRAQKSCLSNSKSDFDKYKQYSANTLSQLTRGQYWKISMKDEGAKGESFIYVWKVTSSAIYFLYQQKDAGTFNHLFIKMTKNFNNEMIDDLRIKKCEKKLNLNYSASSISISINDLFTREGSIRYRTNTNYSASTSYPMFIGSIVRNEKKDKLDDNNTITSTENFVYEISDLSQNAELETSYLNYSRKKYCVVQYSTVDSKKKFNFPFEFSCQASTSTNPNPGDDTTLDFDPANELSLLQ